MRWYLLTLFAAARLEIAVSSQRGVDPAISPRYGGKGGHFACIDGSKSVSSAWINDNYCDCTDGSDEPGTSACANGRFYCRNRGHEPRVLNSSMVDDGVCDCCDGSDEASGECMNTCLEAGASARAELKARAAAYAAGAKVRDGYIKQSRKSRAEWQAQLKRVSSEAAQQQLKVDQAKGRKRKQRAASDQPRTQQVSRMTRRALPGTSTSTLQAAAEKDRAEAEEKAKREAADKARAELEAAKQLEASKLGVATGQQDTTLADTAAEEQPHSQALDAQAPGASETAQAEAPAHTQPPADVPPVLADPVQAAAPEQAHEAELTSEEEAKQRLAQWVRTPDQDKEAAQEPEDLADVTDVEEDTDESPEPEEILIEPNSPPEGAWNMAKQWVLRKLGRAGAVSPQAAKDDFFAQQRQLTELTQEKADLEKKLALDLGHEGEYLPLVDKCIEARVDKYVYSVCLFKDAAQKDGASSTKLGSWAGWEAAGTVMAFTGGQGCWQGPARSIRVSVACGQDETLLDVQEPNRCEYTARLTTPAACKQSDLHAVQQLLATSEREVLEHTEL